MFLSSELKVRFLYVMLGISMILLFFIPLLMAAPETAASHTQPYDLLVLALNQGADSWQVALSYSRIVDHDLLQAGIEQLAAACGCQVSQVRIEDEPLAQAQRTQATGADFLLVGLLKNDPGNLPVELIAKSLPEWQHLRLVFVPGNNFLFRGPQSSEGKEYTIRLVNNHGSFEYDVESIHGKKVLSNGKGPLRRPASGAVLLLAAAIMLPGGLVIILLFALKTRRGRRRI